MIVLFNNNGQTCNQFLEFATSLGRLNCGKRNCLYALVDRSFFDVFKLDSHDGIRLIYTNKILKIICKIIQKIIPDRGKRLPSIIIHWSEAVDYSVLKTERQYILSRLDFHEETKKTIEVWWDEYVHSDIVLGVHIRRGDYILFENGKYFFEDATYSTWINQFIKEQNNKSVQVLIFSNDKINEKKFCGDNIIIMKGNVAEDLYAMSLCDYLIGPPSSFTRCASYMGGNKRMVLKNKDDICSTKFFYDCNQEMYYVSH